MNADRQTITFPEGISVADVNAVVELLDRLRRSRGNVAFVHIAGRWQVTLRHNGNTFVGESLGKACNHAYFAFDERPLTLLEEAKQQAELDAFLEQSRQAKEGGSDEQGTDNPEGSN
ncbi:MAG: hypothetical protein ACF8CY_06785 [Gimesia chilikensis]